MACLLTKNVASSLNLISMSCLQPPIRILSTQPKDYYCRHPHKYKRLLQSNKLNFGNRIMAGHGIKPPPLKLSDLKTFDRNLLRKTETDVTYPDGTRVVEGKDENGVFYRRPSASSPHGFVLDTAEDLQVAEVRPFLLMGSQDVAHNFEILKKHGVTHILNVATGVQNLFPTEFIYQTQEFRDLPEFPIFHGFANAIDFINKCKSSNGCVLVHCNAGISRSSAVVMAYLIKTEGMNVNDAFAYLRSKRPAACPNPGFLIQLESFYSSLQSKK